MSCIGLFRFNKSVIKLGNMTVHQFFELLTQWRHEYDAMDENAKLNAVTSTKMISLTLLQSTLTVKHAEFFANQRNELKKVLPSVLAAKHIIFNDETGFGSVYMDETHFNYTDQQIEKLVDEITLKFCKGLFIGLQSNRIVHSDVNKIHFIRIDEGLTQEAFLEREKAKYSKCALDSCQSIGNFLCICFDAIYCSKACQKSHWKTHHRAVCTRHSKVGNRFVPIQASEGI
jgi:hypothetical protein